MLVGLAATGCGSSRPLLTQTSVVPPPSTSPRNGDAHRDPIVKNSVANPLHGIDDDRGSNSSQLAQGSAGRGWREPEMGEASEASAMIVRGQSPGGFGGGFTSPGPNAPGPQIPGNGGFAGPATNPGAGPVDGGASNNGPFLGGNAGQGNNGFGQFGSNHQAGPYDNWGLGAIPPDQSTNLNIPVTETQTGRFSIGVGVNSDAGVTGQIVIDERNFDWQRLPQSFDDIISGRGFRGAGQGFRIEAAPGNQVQRYMVQFTEPYLFGYSPISFQTSGFYYNRRFFDWDEERLGGRLGLGYRITPDLSVSGALRLEEVDINNPRVRGVPELDAGVGSHGLYSGKLTLIHDTRDIPFFPTEGHYMEFSYEQVFGNFDYPRGEIDLRKYYLIRERPDGSGRHTLGLSLRVGASGSQTPIFENYFSGGYSTMRGFDFRGASPVNMGVVIGGRFRFLGSVEYYFPITADDMVKGVVFCDYGTTERTITMDADNFRVSPGFGLRFNIPAMGPAPLAFDFAVPIAHAPTDNIQNFSFFFGISR
jgi:outer membrane protein insertion porin family